MPVMESEFNGRTPLLALCEHDTNLTPKKLELFLSEQVDFNVMSVDGSTPIQQCCARSANVRTEILDVFQKAGVVLPKQIYANRDRAIDTNCASHGFLEGKRRYWGDKFRPPTPPDGFEHLFD